MSETDKSTYTFKCPKCGATIKVTSDTWFFDFVDAIRETCWYCHTETIFDLDH